MRIYISFILFGASLLSAGCQSNAVDAGAPMESTASPAIEPENLLQLERTKESAEMPANLSVEKFVNLAKQDLASRLQIETDMIVLVKSEEKLWLNAALGCPRPSVFYAQGHVPGFQIWLEVEGIEYIYNTDLNGTLVVCPELNPHLPNTDKGPTPGVPIR